MLIPAVNSFELTVLEPQIIPAGHLCAEGLTEASGGGRLPNQSLYGAFLRYPVPPIAGWFINGKSWNNLSKYGWWLGIPMDTPIYENHVVIKHGWKVPVVILSDFSVGFYHRRWGVLGGYPDINLAWRETNIWRLRGKMIPLPFKDPLSVTKKRTGKSQFSRMVKHNVYHLFPSATASVYSYLE